jgi:hypothetical protein
MVTLEAPVATKVIQFSRDHEYRKTLTPEELSQHQVAWDVAAKCEGCDHIKIEGDRFCWYCGADRDDICGRILAFHLEYVTPVHKASRSSAEEAKIARQWLRDRFGTKHGISVRISRGSSHIRVDIPNEHDWQEPKSSECPSRANVPVRDMQKCAYCTRRREACQHLEAILSNLIPGTGRAAYDPYSDYRQFTWMIY